jgi:hypothetical protein
MPLRFPAPVDRVSAVLCIHKANQMKKPKQNLDAKILVRCTSADLARFKKAAGKQDFSKWVREVVSDAADKTRKATK